jgi:CubicO group peptidase (beta-lactamase class C family)
MGSDGLSKARMQRLHDVMTGHALSGYAPGIVTLVSRRGQVTVDAVGSTERNGYEPMRRDAIFRIASMSKPIVAVAALILVEECKLRLDDPIDRWLPELADRRVLRDFNGPLTETVRADRPITLRDLLTFTWGLGMFVGPGGAALRQAAEERDLFNAPPMPQTSYDADEWLRRLGELPLAHQPGEGWMYNLGSDVVGVLISRASGKPLEMFLRERIFEPLRMVDTSFYVPARKLGRVPPSYLADRESGELILNDPGKDETAWRTPPTFPSGAGGLVSTVDDCLAFGQLLLNKGRYGDERILSRVTAEAMMTDQLTAVQRANANFVPGFFDSRGWGLGGAVVTRRSGPDAVPGAFGWDGGLGTSLWVDPAEELIGVLLTQRAGFPMLSEVYRDFWTSVYQAIDD